MSCEKEEICLSPMTKAPTPTENPKHNVTTQKTPSKTSITQRLLTDLGRSAGATIAVAIGLIKPVYGLQPSH